MTTIISGFSGIYKSPNSQPLENVVIFDCSRYSNTPDGEPNPEFPDNYVSALELAIKDNPDKIYLVSYLREVRKELQNRGIKYIIVLPAQHRRNEYMVRWIGKGSDIEFMHDMYYQWYPLISDCQQDGSPIIRLDTGEFLEDILPKKF